MDTSGGSIPEHPAAAGGEGVGGAARGLQLGPPSGESSTDSPIAEDKSMEDEVFATPVKSAVSKVHHQHSCISL